MLNSPPPTIKLPAACAELQTATNETDTTWIIRSNHPEPQEAKHLNSFLNSEFRSVPSERYFMSS